MAGTHVVTSRVPIDYSKGGEAKRTQVVTTTWVGDASDGSVPDLDIVLNGYLVKALTVPTAIAEVTQVVCVADVAGNLNNKYFTIKSSLNATSYYVWYNVNAAGVDPNPGGTGVQVAVATNATAAAVATATKTALDGVAGTPWSTSRNSATLTITNSTGGYATDAAASNSGFTVTVLTQGNAPTSNYDIAINDPEATISVVGTALDNRSANVTQQIYPVISGAVNPVFLAGTYTIKVTNNSQASATGKIILYLNDCV